MGLKYKLVCSQAREVQGSSPGFADFFRRCYFLFGKINLYHFYTVWTLATELDQQYPRNKQWVLGAATSPEATDTGFCCSPIVVWVEMVLVIFIKPVEGTNICQ